MVHLLHVGGDGSDSLARSALAEHLASSSTNSYKLNPRPRGWCSPVTMMRLRPMALVETAASLKSSLTLTWRMAGRVRCDKIGAIKPGGRNGADDRTDDKPETAPLRGLECIGRFLHRTSDFAEGVRHFKASLRIVPRNLTTRNDIVRPLVTTCILAMALCKKLLNMK